MSRMWISLIASVSLCGGCALLSKSEQALPRYFTPVPAKDVAGASPPANSGLELRLGSVTSASSVRQSLAARSAGHEVTYAQDLRWTEKPEAFLRRALSRALFEQRGIRRIISGAGPTLQVDLIEFEQVMTPPSARASVVVILHDERFVRMETTMTIERPLPSTGTPLGPEASVDALSLALTDVVNRIADEVSARLRESPEPDPRDRPPKRAPKRVPERTPERPEPIDPDSQPVSSSP